MSFELIMNGTCQYWVLDLMVRGGPKPPLAWLKNAPINLKYCISTDRQWFKDIGQSTQKAIDSAENSVALAFGLDISLERCHTTHKIPVKTGVSSDSSNSVHHKKGVVEDVYGVPKAWFKLVKTTHAKQAVVESFTRFFTVSSKEPSQ